MRTEAYIARLLTTASSKNANPTTLANQVKYTLMKVSSAGPAGKEALRLVRQQLIKEALSTKRAEDNLAKGKRPVGRPRKAMQQAA